METHVHDPNPPQEAEYTDDNVITALEQEMRHELANIEQSKEPVEPGQSDVLVQKHVNGLFIMVLSLVALFLIAAIAGIAIYTHR